MTKSKLNKKKAAQILTVPAAAIVDTNDSAKNASDAVKANTNLSPKYKNYKSERNRKNSGS
jgi:hypothetical protein